MPACPVQDKGYPAVFLDDLEEGEMACSLECTRVILEFP